MRSVFSRLWSGRRWWRAVLCAAGASVFFLDPSSSFCASPEKAPYQASGTKRMIERIQEWRRTFGGQNPFAYTDRLKFLREQSARTQDAGQRFPMLAEAAVIMLTLGQVEESLGIFTNLLKSANVSRVNMTSAQRRDLLQMEGLAFLRLGEVNNCLQHHNLDSCLMPIRGAGLHSDTRGSQNAETLFLDLARRNTNDLFSRWLLNIAAMTLGKYPAGVPRALLIPPSVFDSDYPLPKFPEIAAKVGLAVDDLAGGAVAEDFDGDGLLDVVLSSWSLSGQIRYFKNTGRGQFEERTEAAGLAGLTGGLNVMQIDYNNDGWLDLYVVRGAWLGDLGQLPDSLLKNNGDGTFADVTEEAGLLSLHPKLSAVWLDANNDGWLDLFLGVETSFGSHLSFPCQLFLNNHNGTFTECAAAAGVAVAGFVRGVTAGDFDNDGWPDLYISRLSQPNLLLRNDGPAAAGRPPGVHFTDVTARAGVAEPIESFPCWFWDYDNDGWLDIFVCGYSAAYNSRASLSQYVAGKLGRPSTLDKPRLYHNNHDGTFTDVSRAVGLDRGLLAMGANFGDLDNDGFLDFYLGTGAPSFESVMPNEMFRNDRGRRFQNVTTAGGFGHLQKGHAISFADLNNDGQQDVLLNVGGAYAGDNYFDALFANPGNSNRWVCLKLAGKQSNRAAIGARLKVVASAQGRSWEIHRVVGSGGSFGASPLRQEIGLGTAETIDQVEVQWPASGKRSRFTGLAPNQFYEIEEGAAAPRLLRLNSFSWQLEADAAAHKH